MTHIKEGVHAIIQKIGIDSQEHSGDYRKQRKNSTDEKISRENAVFLEDLAKRREMLKKNNEREYARMSERLVSRLRREILTYQHNLIDEIFDMAVSKLKNASKEEFTDMFKAAVKGLKGSFVLYMGELSTGKLDMAEIVKTAKENGGMEIAASSEVIPQKSGFVLRDERVEYNCLFEDLIEDKKNTQAASVLKEVFGDFKT
ncbi:MAG: hypothetical protein FWD23_09210 [Oscillospiraceae bacterium]|nr:hypothetical protein [Oscillospiraceae bacterium]